MAQTTITKISVSYTELVWNPPAIINKIVVEFKTIDKNSIKLLINE